MHNLQTESEPNVYALLGLNNGIEYPPLNVKHRTEMMKSLERKMCVKLLAAILLLVIFVAALVMIGRFCEDLWLCFLFAVVMVGALWSRLVAYIMLPVAYIGLFHIWWVFDAYEQIMLPGDWYLKLRVLKLSYVHSTPLMYWVGVMCELFAVGACCYFCRYLFRMVRCKAIREED